MRSQQIGGDMGDFEGAESREEGVSLSVHSAGRALRREILNKIAPILVECNGITDSNQRLLIQACCLDAVTGLEDVIREYGLDGCARPGCRGVGLQ